MSSFRFKTLERVTLPADTAFGKPDVQGVVVGGGVELDGTPKYTIQFLNRTDRGPNGLLNSLVVTVAEPDLIAAQPPVMVPATDAVAGENAAFERGRSFERAAADFARIERASKRKRKKSAKAKSKSKRKR